MCSYCSNADCGEGASLSMQFTVDGMKWPSLPESDKTQFTNMVSVLIKRIAGTSESPVDNIVFHGGASPYTEFNFVLTVPAGSSASEVAEKLRRTNFSEAFETAESRQLHVNHVFIEPTAFVTTTVTYTTTTEQSTTASTTVIATTKFLHGPSHSSTEEPTQLSGAESAFVKGYLVFMLCIAVVFPASL